MNKNELLKQIDEIENPNYLIVVVQLPTGAKELIVNTENLDEKISYYAKAYNENFELKANNDVKIVGFMVV